MKLLKDWRILLLLISILVSILLIGPKPAGGVEVTYIEFNSSAWGTGIEKGMVIYEINGVTLTTPADFYSEVDKIQPGSIVELNIDKKPVSIFAKNATFGIEVNEKPPTNIQFGLDLQGGTRAVVTPITDAPSKNATEATKQVLEARMNNYGLQDVKSRTVRAADDNWYIQVEMAGPGSERILNVIKNVGVFEVKILNSTIFSGSEVVSVSAPTAVREGGYGVPFTIKSTAAKALQKSYVTAAGLSQACMGDAECPENYACSVAIGMCRPSIRMYLDGDVKFAAPPNEGLHSSWKGGVLQQELVARVGSPEDAKGIEVVMRSGSLPKGITGIEIISRDYVDATLGADFVRSAIIAGLAALLAVTLIVLIRYKSFKIATAIMMTGISEVLILLGAAALFGQDLDLPSIAGIIAAVGTGVDQQVIITDEIISGKAKHLSSTQQLKRAFSIIIIASATTLATMFPLMTLGIGLVKGFAIMTFLGVFFGFTITRPAYAKILNEIL